MTVCKWVRSRPPELIERSLTQSPRTFWTSYQKLQWQPEGLKWKAVNQPLRTACSFNNLGQMDPKSMPETERTAENKDILHLATSLSASSSLPSCVPGQKTMPICVHSVSIIHFTFKLGLSVYLKRKWGVYSKNALTTARKQAGESTNIMSRDHTHLTHLQSQSVIQSLPYSVIGFSLTVPPSPLFTLLRLHLGAFVDVIVWIVLHISLAFAEVPPQNSRNDLQQWPGSAQSWHRHNGINHLSRLHYNQSINGSVYNVHVNTMRLDTC